MNESKPQLTLDLDDEAENGSDELLANSTDNTPTANREKIRAPFVAPKSDRKIPRFDPMGRCRQFPLKMMA